MKREGRHALIAKKQPTNPRRESERPYEGVQGACAVFMMRYTVVAAIIMSKMSVVDQGCIQAFLFLVFRHVVEFDGG